MKIVSLNTWGGRAGKEKLLDFFKHYADEIDVFCLQEIWAAPHWEFKGRMTGGVPIDHRNTMFYGRQEISSRLFNHNVYFHPHLGDNYGLMMLVKNSLAVVENGEIFVYKEKGHVPDGDLGNHARNIQYVTVQTPEKVITVMNFHGLWNGSGKGDSEDRLMQSTNILKFVEKLNNPFVICGDFNLLPETESLKKIEAAGLRNLIREYKVTSTRTSFYKKPEKFADYVFVSDGLTVTDFRVLPEEVSDHAPLFVDIL